MRLRASGKGTTNPKEKDEYLNANYVDGFRRPSAYIATQGPMKNTTDLFWRMVYEQKSSIIVMITHLVENGKVEPAVLNHQSVLSNNHHDSVSVQV